MSKQKKMKIVKRNGKKEDLKLDKISKRIERQTYKLSNFVDADDVAIKVISGCKEGITTREIDKLAYETAASLTVNHPDYSLLASRLAITTMQKDTPKVFSDTIERLHKYIHPKTGEPAGLVSDETYNVIMKHKDILNSSIIGDRDFEIDFFGFKTLEKSYLLRINGEVAERIQHFWMRVAVGIWGDNLEEILKTYEILSTKEIIHATPTLFNAGTKKPQMSSCFLLDIGEDSIKSIYKTLGNCAEISQSAGGIGLHIHKIRAAGSYIKGTNGYSNGIIPMLRNFDMTARYVDQGGGKRKGSFAIYLETWHADIMDFLDLKKNHGKEELRARDLFYAMWTSDLFMERVNKDLHWTLMSPDECPGLDDAYGDDFKQLYERYESENKGIKTIKARELWNKIIESQNETGTPYMLYKDAANIKSNQKNIGTIKSSNLCTEIMEYSSPEEIAVCNLASIALPMYIKSSSKKKSKKIYKGKLEFDHDKLFKNVYQVVKNLNRVIDVNYYPVPETKTSNMRHRPVGLGVQGLADTFAMLGLPFDSDDAKQLNKEIFETIYFAAVTSSKDLAIQQGHYETFPGSPMSQGVFQFDMWEEREVEKNKQTKEWEITNRKPIQLSGRWDWDKLKEEVKKYGVRNSLLISPMPTASCQIVSTEIQTEEGIKSYSEIMADNFIDWQEIEKEDVPQWFTLSKPVNVLTQNGYVETEKMYYNGHKEVYAIEMEDGSIFEATANHQFLVNRHGREIWLRVDELCDSDDIVNINEKGLKIEK